MRSDSMSKNLSLTNIYKRGNRINGSLNVYFQADNHDAFYEPADTAKLANGIMSVPHFALFL